MTTKQFTVLAKRLMPQLPGFTVVKKLMIMLPVEHFVRAVCFDPSAFNKTSFSATTFIMPLFVPSPYLTLNFADRVRTRQNGDSWESDMPNLIEELGSALKKQAAPRLSSIRSVSDFVNMARGTPMHDPHTLRAIAFALVFDGRNADAMAVIDNLNARIDTQSAWQVEIGKMARTVKAKLTEDPAEARKQLETWEGETIKNLGLEAVAKA